MLSGSGLRASIDSSRGWAIGWGCFPIESRRQTIRSAPRGLHPHQALSRSPPTLSGSPPPYPKPPSYAPRAVHNPLSLPTVPLSGAPRTGASNCGLRPEITMLARCRNGARSQCFSMGRQNRGGGKNKQWTGTLKAQSVHRRWRKVSLTMGGGEETSPRKMRRSQLDDSFMSNCSLIPAAGSVHGCFRGEIAKCLVSPLIQLKTFTVAIIHLNTLPGQGRLHV